MHFYHFTRSYILQAPYDTVSWFTSAFYTSAGLPGVSHNVSECPALQELHDDPELVSHQVTIVHIHNVFMMVVSHDYNLRHTHTQRQRWSSLRYREKLMIWRNGAVCCYYVTVQQKSCFDPQKRVSLLKWLRGTDKKQHNYYCKFLNSIPYLRIYVKYATKIINKFSDLLNLFV